MASSNCEQCCDVCVETFNKSSRKEIPCATCDFKLCLSCFEQYQHEHSGLYEVSCMNCKQLWEDQYVRETVPASVVKRLTGATKKRLRDSEVAYMPETQMYVEYGKGIETIKTKEYVECTKKMNEIALKLAEEEIKPKPDSEVRYDLKRKSQVLKNDAKVLHIYIQNWRQTTYVYHGFKDIIPEELYNKRFRTGSPHFVEQKKSEPSVLCPCPAEDCRGFVSRSKHQCGVCDQKVCGKCLVPVNPNEEHTCQESDIQTAEFVLKTSKPCPKCAARIHKIEGCDQMWCTQCNTPFSYRTGEVIVGGVIHNPHYYEWLRNHRNNTTQEEPALNNCEGLPEAVHVNRHIEFVFRNDPQFTRFVREVHRKCVHYQHIEQRTVRNNEDHTTAFRKNLDIRLKWIRNEITDKVFESGLHRRYKQNIVNSRCNQVYDLINTLCSDVFHRLLRENQDSEEIRARYKTEFTEIFDYANSRFVVLEKIYKNHLPRVASFVPYH